MLMRTASETLTQLTSQLPWAYQGYMGSKVKQNGRQARLMVEDILLTRRKEKLEVALISSVWASLTENNLVHYLWYHWLLSVDMEKLENCKRCILILNRYNKYPLALGVPKHCFWSTVATFVISCLIKQFTFNIPYMLVENSQNAGASSLRASNLTW